MRNVVVRDAEILAEKRGVPIYTSNPSVPSPEEIKRPRRIRLGNEMKGLVVDSGSGEVIGHGGAWAHKWEEVDAERFVKLYLAGLRKAAGLSKAGLAVFELVYRQLQDRPGQDTITLSLLTSGMKKTAYYSGVRDLLSKEFLFRSPYDGTFFVNIRFLFENEDDFTRNLCTFRAEERAALAVALPQGIVGGTLPAGSTQAPRGEISGKPVK
jgi:hypothetical protein